MYSLAVEENRATIGVLGAIPLLLELFVSTATGYRARREAGMPLYYVSLVRLMRSDAVAPGTSEEEYCILTLYGMSRGSLQFCRFTRAAGVEAALLPVAEGDGGGGAHPGAAHAQGKRGELKRGASGVAARRKESRMRCEESNTGGEKEGEQDAMRRKQYLLEPVRWTRDAKHCT